MNRIRRSGLTLVESLASIALLTMLAAALTPMLCVYTATSIAVDATLTERERYFDLIQLVDRFMNRPADLGLNEEANRAYDASNPFEMMIRWPDAPQRDAIQVRRIDMPQLGATGADGRPERHAWLLFEWDGMTASRWIVLREVDRKVGGGAEP